MRLYYGANKIHSDIFLPCSRKICQLFIAPRVNNSPMAMAAYTAMKKLTTNYKFFVLEIDPDIILRLFAVLSECETLTVPLSERCTLIRLILGRAEVFG